MIIAILGQNKALVPYWDSGTKQLQLYTGVLMPKCEKLSGKGSPDHRYDLVDIDIDRPNRYNGNR